METELEIRNLEQIEQTLAVDEIEESTDLESEVGLTGLFTNGFLTG